MNPPGSARFAVAKLLLLLFPIAFLHSGCGAATVGSAGGADTEQESSPEFPSDDEGMLALLDGELDVQRADFDDAIASENWDCPQLCDIRNNICDLSGNICQISFRNPSNASTMNRCQDAGRSCEDADVQVLDQCGCEYVAPEERPELI